MKAPRVRVPWLIGRYLLAEFLRNFGGALVAITMLLTLGKVFEEINRVVRDGPPAWTVLAYFACRIPHNMTMAAPLSVLLGTLFTLARMLRSHELVAMRAGGVGQFAIAAPFLIPALLVSVGVLVFDETVLPWANLTRMRIRRTYIRPQNAREWQTALRAAAWTERGQLVYAEEANGETGVLRGVTIVEFAGRTPVARVDAASARPALRGTSGRARDGWRLEQAQAYRWTGNRVQLDLADRMSWPVAAGLEDFVREDKPVETQSMAELQEAIRSLRLAGKDYNEELVYYYFKWAFPCASFVVALLGLGIAFAFQASPREGPAKAFGVARFAAAGYIGLIQFGQALGVGGVLPAPVAAWIANVVFLGVGLAFLRRGWR